MDIIKSIEHEQLKNKIPNLKIGDTVRVHQRIKEGNRERIQVFEGIIIKKQGGGVNATFTVRRVAYGVGTEKTFLIHPHNSRNLVHTQLARKENGLYPQGVCRIRKRQSRQRLRSRYALPGRSRRLVPAGG